MGCGIEPRKKSYIAGAESLYSLEGNMCGTVLRGAVALPGSKATSRAKGSYRNLGDLISDPLALRLNGPRREGEEPTPAMYGDEKSDRAIVAMKLANKAEQSAAESGERSIVPLQHVATSPDLFPGHGQVLARKRPGHPAEHLQVGLFP